MTGGIVLTAGSEQLGDAEELLMRLLQTMKTVPTMGPTFSETGAPQGNGGLGEALIRPVIWACGRHSAGFRCA
jgi:hypothetical protein